METIAEKLGTFIKSNMEYIQKGNGLNVSFVNHDAIFIRGLKELGREPHVSDTAFKVSFYR